MNKKRSAVKVTDSGRLRKKAKTMASSSNTTTKATTDIPLPTVLEAPLPAGYEDLVIPKKNVGPNDNAPRADEFEIPGEFVAIFTTFNPARTSYAKTIWDLDPLFHKYLRPLLKQYGWTDQEFVLPVQGVESCFYTGPDGAKCQTVNSGHHGRHMTKHLPDGIGYFFMCPVCKSLVRRVDMFNRHRKSCTKYKTGPFPEFYQHAFEQNAFCR